MRLELTTPAREGFLDSSDRTRCEQYRNEIASLRTLGEFAAEIDSTLSEERIKAAIARAEAYRDI